MAETCVKPLFSPTISISFQGFCFIGVRSPWFLHDFQIPSKEKTALNITKLVHRGWSSHSASQAKARWLHHFYSGETASEPPAKGLHDRQECCFKEEEEEEWIQSMVRSWRGTGVRMRLADRARAWQDIADWLTVSAGNDDIWETVHKVASAGWLMWKPLFQSQHEIESNSLGLFFLLLK